MFNKPFLNARLRLAISYTGVMTLILVVSSFAIYRLIAHARWLSLDGEMNRMATLIERQIKPALGQAGQLEPEAADFFPGLCWEGEPCQPPIGPVPAGVSALRDQLVQKEFCVRLLDTQQRPVAFWEMPKGERNCNGSDFWDELTDQDGNFYRSDLYPLYMVDRTQWGYLNLARSIDALDIYLFWIEVSLVALLSLTILATGAASWWLAGLALQPVRQSYQQMQQFTADAAHELRTPLATLRSIVQTALRSDALTPEEVETTLQTVNRQSQRLSKLVQDLLLLYQADQAISERFRLCDLSVLVYELGDDFLALAIAADLNLKVEVLYAESIYVLGDRDSLYRAIANLLSNAIHYTPAGGQVTLRLLRHHQTAQIQVVDTGVGIAADDQAKVFDRFYRVEQARSRERGGTGLGLAIVSTIVQQHRGTISLESVLGKGSKFTIQLEIAPQSDS